VILLSPLYAYAFLFLWEITEALWLHVLIGEINLNGHKSISLWDKDLRYCNYLTFCPWLEFRDSEMMEYVAFFQWIKMNYSAKETNGHDWWKPIWKHFVLYLDIDLPRMTLDKTMKPLIFLSFIIWKSMLLLVVQSIFSSNLKKGNTILSLCCLFLYTHRTYFKDQDIFTKIHVCVIEKARYTLSQKF